MLDALLTAYPRLMTCDELSDATGISVAGGTWRTYLGELRTLELVVDRGDDLRASDVFFK